MEPVPTLVGAGVVVRPWNIGDVAVVMAVASDPLIPLISSVPDEPSRDGALAFVERQNQRLQDEQGWACAVAAGPDQPASGFAGVLWTDHEAGRASIGYWAESSARRRGVMGPAVRLLVDWALRQPGLMRLEAHIEPWNTASVRVAEGAGLEHEGLMRSFAPIGGRRMDALLYARVAEQP